jgi:protein-tyrosine phosphatase
MGELLIRRGIGDTSDHGAAAFRVSSAGTHAWTDQAMHPFAAEVLQESGADPSGFRSRRLSADLVAGADLVLTATRQERSACVVLEPAAVRRTFTIPQFGRYIAAMSAESLLPHRPPPERLRSLIDHLSLVRGELPVADVDQDDLPDPVDQPIQAFRRCGAEIERVVEVLRALIAPIPRVRPASSPPPAHRC